MCQILQRMLSFRRIVLYLTETFHFREDDRMKKCRIVATVGPACESPAMLEKIIRAGVNVCRLNSSFGTNEDRLAKIRNIRNISAALRKPVAILQDLQGPKIRVGKLKEPVKVKKGETLILTGGTEHTERLRLPTTYTCIAKDCEAGKIILVADGRIILKVEKTDRRHDAVYCKVINGGEILSGKGINLPYTKISLPALTEKDEADAVFGAEAGVDYIGMSFVRTPADVYRLKNLFRKIGKSVPVIAKIEKPEAVENIGAILEVVDGVMVARGDLAVELSYAKVPTAQKMIIHEANRHGKITITATEMLSSMIENPLPTRADVSDVANAVWDGTDAVMLSNESAMGKYPVEAVKAMKEIIIETEAAKGVFRHDKMLLESMDLPEVTRGENALCKAVSSLSHDMNERGIAVLSKTGETAKMLSKYRPGSPIFALSNSISLCSRMAMYHNVVPVFIPYEDQDELSEHDVARILRDMKHVKNGDTLICVSGRRSSRDSSQWAAHGISTLVVGQ